MRRHEPNESLRSIASSCFAAIAGLALATTAVAQNLVVNGDFDTNVSGWSTAYHGTSISIAWSSFDPADPTPSGSVEVTSTATSGGSGGPTQCVDLVIADPYLKMDAMVPAQAGFAYVNAAPYVRWYSGAGCTIGEISTEFVLGTVMAGEGWRHLEGPISPPQAAQAVLLDLGMYKPSGSSAPAVAYFDNVYLPEPAGGGAAVAASCALAALRRRARRAATPS